MRIFLPEIAALTLRQILGRRRAVIAILLCAMPAALVAWYRSDSPPQWMATFLPTALTDLVLTAVVPLTALLLGAGAFATEMEDGTLLYLLTKPISRTSIALTKILVVMGSAAGLAMACVAGAIAASGQGWSDPTHTPVAFLVAAGLGGLLYGAAFTAVGLVTRRGVQFGLLYLVLWEGAFPRVLNATSTLSIKHYLLSIADAIAAPDLIAAPAPLSTALWVAALLPLVALGVSIHRLSRHEPEKVM